MRTPSMTTCCFAGNTWSTLPAGTLVIASNDLDLVALFNVEAENEP